MLKVKGIDTYYGNVQALSGIDLEVGESEIVAVIGSNGAGKSTLMNSISGIVPARRGTIEFQGKDITKLKPHKIASLGVVQIPEGREIFPNMTVYENLEMGSYSVRRTKKGLAEKIEEMYQLFPRLRERKNQKAGSLSGGEQQMVAIARGLMADPKLLMCDEPSLGLAPVIVDEVFAVIQKVNRELGIPIIIVEQNAYMALSISSRCYVLENGAVTNTGPSSELIKSDAIKKAYLGK